MEVRSCAVKNRAVLNGNCVVERRGGEQRNEKGQSETKGHREVGGRELDSVGVSGRVCLGKTKPEETGKTCRSRDCPGQHADEWSWNGRKF